MNDNITTGRTITSQHVAITAESDEDNERFKSNLVHAVVLKLLGRVCRPFESYNARELVSAVAHGGYPI